MVKANLGLSLGHKGIEKKQSLISIIIKKKSGKWRLLHDLRAINEQMNLFGPVQRGLPVLSALPRGWNLIIIDIKDCFLITKIGVFQGEVEGSIWPSFNCSSTS